MLGFAFVERTLAAMFYGAGRTEMERATGESLIKEARVAGWLTDEEFVSLNKARRLRNPLMHFRAPLHEELPEVRSFKENREPHEVVESDAKHILESMFRLLAQNAVG
ncbi:MAG TPA: hypothetical protein VD948_11570 [Rhodothermales bacterium]|nr:hypothetical protein [Rhodothermales bacterium]